MRNLAVAIIVLAVAGMAGATTIVSGVTTTPMAGGTAWQISLSSDCDWTNSRITVWLDQGSLIDPHAFQLHDSGVNDSDTWVDAASPVDLDTNVLTGTLQGSEVLDWSWFDTTNDGAQSWLAAQIILSNDASGVAYLLSFDRDNPGVPQEAEIIIPEPATLGLLALGGLGLMKRRRRR